MIRRTFWQSLFGCAAVALLAGCGSDNSTFSAPPGTRAPAVNSIAPLENAALYGMVRLRVSNITSATAPVSVKVGGVTSSAATIAYTDAAATSGTGGEVDFRVPYGLTAGSQSLVVTVNGLASAAYPVTISDANPFAVFTLASGAKFVAELRADKAPNTVANFVGLATGKTTWTPTYDTIHTDPVTMATTNVTVTAASPTNTPLYNGVTFHRVIPGFVYQVGDPITAFATAPTPPANDDAWTPGTGGPGFTIPYETSSLTNVKGALAMARKGSSTVAGDPTGLNTASSQIFIDMVDRTDLDTLHYAVFGLVVEGFSNLSGIVPTEGAGFVAGTPPTKLTSVTISGKIDSAVQARSKVK